MPKDVDWMQVHDASCSAITSPVNIFEETTCPKLHQFGMPKDVDWMQVRDASCSAITSPFRDLIAIKNYKQTTTRIRHSLDSQVPLFHAPQPPPLQFS